MVRKEQKRKASGGRHPCEQVLVCMQWLTHACKQVQTKQMRNMRHYDGFISHTKPRMRGHL